MATTKKLCHRLAKILGGKGEHDKNECIITIKRKLKAKISGKRYITEHEIVVQSLSHGKSLNTAELVVLVREVNPLIHALKRKGLLVSAVHNHWLFEKPRLMYVHVEAVSNPIDFARKLSSALRVLKKSKKAKNTAKS